MLLLRFTVFWVVFFILLVATGSFQVPVIGSPEGYLLSAAIFFCLELHIFSEIKKNERGTNVFLASG